MITHENTYRAGLPCDFCPGISHFTGYGQNNTPLRNTRIYAGYRCISCGQTTWLPTKWHKEPVPPCFFNLTTGIPVRTQWFSIQTMTWNGQQWIR